MTIYFVHFYALNFCLVCFRCLVNVSLATTNLPTDLLPGNSKFNILVQRDVLMNVYRDGVFGSYRRTPFLKSKSSPYVSSTHLSHVILLWCICEYFSNILQYIQYASPWPSGYSGWTTAWQVHNSTDQTAWVRAHHGEHTYGRPIQWNKWVPASRAGKVNRLAVREEWRTLHGIAHEPCPNAKKKEMGSSARINDPVSTLTLFSHAHQNKNRH